MEERLSAADGKDSAPRWNPSTLEAVDRDAVERFFRPRFGTRDHPLAHL